MYFGQRYQQPAFRISSSVLRNTGSEAFLSLLKRSRRFQDGDSSSVECNRSLGTTAVAPSHRGTSSDDSSSAVSSRPTLDSFRPSPNLKRDKSNPSLSFTTGSRDSDNEGSLLYDIYFPAPTKLSRAAAIRFHLTTRNVLALLSNKALVGLDFCTTLTDLQRRLEVYMPPKANCAKRVVRYLVLKQLHNVSNSPGMAAGLLAWSEGVTVRWHEGWREAFVHCCGMYPRLNQQPEWEHVTEVTRNLLESAYAELQARIRAAEDRLLTFKFDDIWPAHKTQQHPARFGYDSFRLFLRQHFERTYKSWKTRVRQENCTDSWLTRELVNQLQEDHGALYDFLVDRQMVWGSGGKILRKDGRPCTTAIADDTLIANLLANFDQRHDYTPILHPYPLLPFSVPVEASGDNSGSSRLSLSSFGNRSSRARDKRVAQANADANNGRLVANTTKENALVEAFRKYEKSDGIRQFDPHDARKGRWMLLYCTLQVLAGISVDTPHMFFKDVPYFLNPRLTNTPPWAVTQLQHAGAKTVIGIYDEASRLYSHCWIVPKTWEANGDAAGGLTEHKQYVITADGIEGFSLQSNMTSTTTTTTLEVRGETFGLGDAGSCDEDEDDTKLADLERVGSPGFRAPLKSTRSQTFREHTGNDQIPEVPSSLTRSLTIRKGVTNAEMGRSHYSPPNEW